jgi:hypothetical protein
VKGAYDSLQKVRDLLSKDPGEIVKNATSAVANPLADGMAQNFFQGAVKLQSRMSAAKNTANEGLQRAATTVSNLLVTPNGSAVTDSNGAPITSNFWNRSWKRLFDTAVEKLKQSKIAMDKIRLSSGIGENGKPLASSIIVDYILKHPDILIPFLPVPYNIAAIAIRLVQTYIERIRKQSAAATSGGGHGVSNRIKNRKYLKNTKHFNRYISNLRKKTAKKEMELINSIQEFKSI